MHQKCTGLCTGLLASDSGSVVQMLGCTMVDPRMVQVIMCKAGARMIVIFTGQHSLVGRCAASAEVVMLIIGDILSLAGILLDSCLQLACQFCNFLKRDSIALVPVSLLNPGLHIALKRTNLA